ncbi:MAG: hypothetical protein CME71_07950 [Halobacteriovorax sp.]|nr:hypothetical protein [Halobacteriovorax sp.]
MKLHLFHGLNLKPTAMLPLAKALSFDPVIHSLNDHKNPKLLNMTSHHWHRWELDANRWCASLDQNSMVLCYSISAPLLINALNENNKEVGCLIMLSPAFYFKSLFRFLAYLDYLPDRLPIPSFNKPEYRCARTLPLGMYKSIKENLPVPKRLPSHKSLMIIHRHDELLDATKTIDLGRSLGAQTLALNSTYPRPYHASFKPNETLVNALSNFIKSDI